MAKATAKNITNEPNCPASALLSLIGAHWRIHNELDELNLSDAGERLLERRASLMATRVAACAMEALAVTPASSLRGAVGTVLAAHHFLEEAADDREMDKYEARRRQFLASAMLEDAMKYFGTHHGLSWATSGLGVFELTGPFETIDEGRASTQRTERNCETGQARR